MPADVKTLKQDLTAAWTARWKRCAGNLPACAPGGRTRPAGAGEGPPTAGDAAEPGRHRRRAGGADADRAGLGQVHGLAVEKAIRDAGLGLNPAADGMLVRVPIPQLTTERRNELAKMAHKYAEGAKISVRGVRRDGMEQIKGHEKKHEIGEDLAKNWSDEVQKLTDQYVKKVDEALVDKEKDIRQV